MPYADHARRKAYHKAYNAKNSAANVARVKQWKRDNPDRARRADIRLWLKNKYAMTVEGWHRLLISQAGECAICGGTMDRPYVDHDHKTGRVRALLCQLCNVGLGSFRENPEILRKAADYISNPKTGRFL